MWDTSVEMWNAIHDANLKGHFLCTREVLRQSMRARNEGVIIFISSGSGKKGEEDSSAYCASKWGVIGFAESVAKDRVPHLSPGTGVADGPRARHGGAGDRTTIGGPVIGRRLLRI